MPFPVEAAIIGGASLLGSGKSKKGGDDRGEDLAGLQAQIAQELFQSSGPIRELLLTRGPVVGGSHRRAAILPAFLERGTLPEALQVPLTATREGLEDQFGRAREAVIQRVGAQGGQLRDLLAGLETDRAQAVGRLALDELPIRQNLFSQALQIAAGSPVQAAQVAGSAGGLFEQIAARETQQSQAAGESLGQGAALATKLGLKNTGGGGGGGTALLASPFIGFNT